MSLDELIRQYGYLALFLGTMLQGETAVIMAGVAARAGLMKIQVIFGTAFLATFIGTELAYAVGMGFGGVLLKRFPVLEKRVAIFEKLVFRYQNPLVLFYRFMYGIRSVAPFALGFGRIPFIQFSALNGVGALIWAALFSAAGYLFGITLQLVFQDIRKYESRILLAILIVAVGFWLLQRLRHRATKQD